MTACIPAPQTRMGGKGGSEGCGKKNGFLSFFTEGVSSQCVTFPAASAGGPPARAAVFPGDTEDFTVKKIGILGYVSVRCSQKQRSL